MSTYLLLPGAGSDSWYWHRVVPLLRAAGHDAIAVDLPYADHHAGLEAHAEAAVAAAAGVDDDLNVVAHSLAGFVAPIVCDRRPVSKLLLVAAMVPRPGESAGAWWDATGAVDARNEHAAAIGGPGADEPFDPFWWFLHDVPHDIAMASAAHVVDPGGRIFTDPWPLRAWPSTPTRLLVCRDDRFFPPALLREVAQSRLGFDAGEVDEMEGGHLPALAHPSELTSWLLANA